MNAIAKPQDNAARKARHLALAQELTEIGMNLARLAAARAQTLFAEEAEAPPPEPQDAEPPRPAPHAAAPLTPAQSHAFTFARMATIVRLAATFEARVAADAFQPAAAGARAPYRPDARRGLLRQALHDAAAREPEPSVLRRAIDSRIEDELAADPEALTPIWDLLETISQDMDLTLDMPRLPDACLPPMPDDMPPLDMVAFRALLEADWQSRAPPS